MATTTTTTTIQAHYRGTIRGQLRYVPALNRGTSSGWILSAVTLFLALLTLPYVYFTVFGVILSILIVSGYYLIPAAWWSMRRSRWLFDAPVDLTVTDEGLGLSTAGGNRKVPWEAVRQVREMKNVFAVRFQAGGSYCVPKSALEGSVLTDFRELAASHVPLIEL